MGLRLRKVSLVVPVVAVSVALGGCSGTVTASTPTTDAPIVELPQANVPFAGDCHALLTSDAVAVPIGERVVERHDSHTPIGVVPDSAGSLAQLGGVRCVWEGTASPDRFLSVTVLPAAKVPTAVITGREELGCYGRSVCGRGEIQSGMWVLAETHRVSYAATPTGEELAALSAVVDGAMGAVLAHDADDITGVPIAAAEDWWTLPGCDALNQQ